MLNPSEYTSVYKVSPLPSIILYTNKGFTIADVNLAYLDMINSTNSKLIGRSVFDTSESKNVFELKYSLDQVILTKTPHQMDFQKYKISIENSDKYCIKYFLSVNTPVLSENGEVCLIIHSVTDVTDQKQLEQEKADSEQLKNKAYELASIGTWEYNMLVDKLSWSSLTKKIHGFGDDYVPDVESTINLFKEGFHRDTFAQAASDAIDKEKPFDIELKIISGQGDERWIRATGEPEYKDGICHRFYGISQNVTARRKAKEDLQINERRFRALIQNGSDLTAILDDAGKYSYVSSTSKKVLGIPSDDMIGKSIFNCIHEDDRMIISKCLSALSPLECIQLKPYRYYDSCDNWKWIQTTITNLKNDPAVRGVVVNSRDITEQILQQQLILDSLKEKKTLLAEIHHRVKNNLAVITGLLQLQAYNLDTNDKVTDKLNDSVARIKTMANIHEQLYQSKSFSKIDLADNIRLLVTDILNRFKSKIDVDIKFDCETLLLNITQAIPFSLIINEVVTNILKHAFGGWEKGVISIKLFESTVDEVVITITDNGIELPKAKMSAHPKSLGLNLIHDLSSQLKADYSFNSSDEGTSFNLQFQKTEPTN